jgi:hypothetical protein
MKAWIDYHIPRVSFDINLAQEDFGFQVQVSLEMAISDYPKR